MYIFYVLFCNENEMNFSETEAIIVSLPPDKHFEGVKTAFKYPCQFIGNNLSCSAGNSIADIILIYIFPWMPVREILKISCNWIGFYGKTTCEMFTGARSVK